MPNASRCVHVCVCRKHNAHKTCLTQTKMKNMDSLSEHRNHPKWSWLNGFEMKNCPVLQRNVPKTWAQLEAFSRDVDFSFRSPSKESFFSLKDVVLFSLSKKQDVGTKSI